MKKIVYLISAFLLMFLVDFMLSHTEFPINKVSYLQGYRSFYEMAQNTKGQKRIILLGGSSLGWGVSAKKIQQETGILTLNAGIHAGMGYRGFFNTAVNVLDKDNDLIIISPEVRLPSFDFAWSRSKVFCEINISVVHRYPLKCIGYTLNKLARINPILDRVNGDYFKSGFNNVGDYVFRRPNINMINKVYPNSVCMAINIDDLKNEYIPFYRGIVKAGYTVAYIPTFIPFSSCSNLKLLNKFHNILYRNFGVEGFQHVQQTFDEKYFYNTTYHLTHEGVKLKTKLFLRQIKKFLISQKQIN